jgi:tetratricopeptide (TPR) repeat protein
MIEASDRTESVFAAALALATPAERAAYLEMACANDPVLRARIEALLRAHDRAGHILDRPATDLCPTVAYPPLAEQAGCLVAGRYKLLEAIGEGGMGTVWLAEQTQPVRRKVAVKLVKAGMDSKSVLARFEVERQALALMDHPNIARVLDGGLTDSGRPFFVMDYVKGVPITEYCDAARLGVPERLRLFLAVCQAVQHAHQKGIIHRDLKPSNILVCLHDGQPVPKVIDFGLAKAVHQPLTEHTLCSAHGMVVGTPLYMSPEQAEVNNLDIDTRSDVYSLGVILYELLTGSTPLDRQRFNEATWPEMLRMIKEEEPPRPSTRLSGAGTPPSVATQRQAEPAKLAKVVRGELDWITMKALAKERSRRYETANALARDVERYLKDEQVEACPPSMAYRVKKFLRRYRGPVAAAAVVLLTLVAGIVGTTMGLFRAEQAWQDAVKAQEAEAARAEGERQAKNRALKAEKLAATRLGEAQAQKALAETNAQKAIEEKGIADVVRNFLQIKLLGQADVRQQADFLLRAGGLASAARPDVTVRELLDRAAAELAPDKIEASFPRQPRLQAELLQTVGRTYLGVRDFGKAIAFLQRSANLRQQPWGVDAAGLDTLYDLASAHVEAGHFAEGIQLLERIHPAVEKTLGANHPNTLRARMVLANAYCTAGNLPEATARLEQLRKVYEKQYPPEHPATLALLNNLALTYYRARRLPEAVALFEQVAKALERIRGLDHPHTLLARLNLGRAYAAIGQPQRAIELLEQVRAACEIRFGRYDGHTFHALRCLASAHDRAGTLPTGIKLCEQLYKEQQKMLGRNNPETLYTGAFLGALYRSNKQPDKSIALFEEIVQPFEAVDRAHPTRLRAMAELGASYRDAGRFDKALPLLEKAYRVWPPDIDVVWVGTELLTAYVRAGKQAEICALVPDLAAKARQRLSRGDSQLSLVLQICGKQLLERNHEADAEPILRECLALRLKVPTASSQVAYTKSLLGRALLGQRKYAEAEPLLLAGYEGLKKDKAKIPPEAKVWLSDAVEPLVRLYEATGKNDEAARWRKEREALPVAATRLETGR